MNDRKNYMKEYSKQYHIKNKDIIREKNKKYYQSFEYKKRKKEYYYKIKLLSGKINGCVGRPPNKNILEILRLSKENLTQKEIGKQFGITQGAIYWIWKKHDIKRKKNIYGENNPKWKGGVMFDRNRKLIYSPNHPKPDRKNYCYEYRLIMEKKLGRYLEDDEIIHHINGNVEDNGIENLQLMNRCEHIKLHIKQGDMKVVTKNAF